MKSLKEIINLFDFKRYKRATLRYEVAQRKFNIDYFLASKNAQAELKQYYKDCIEECKKRGIVTDDVTFSDFGFEMYLHHRTADSFCESKIYLHNSRYLSQPNGEIYMVLRNSFDSTDSDLRIDLHEDTTPEDVARLIIKNEKHFDDGLTHLYRKDLNEYLYKIKAA